MEKRVENREKKTLIRYKVQYLYQRCVPFHLDPLYACEVESHACQVYLLRETFLYPLHRRDRQRTQLRGTLTEVSVHDL